MIEGAQKTYPPSEYPDLHFAVADCSKPEHLPRHDEPFDVVFAGWLLNYAASEAELVDMFRLIEAQLKTDGRFVGVTTNVDDPFVKEPKLNFYGLDIEVVEKEYVAPDTGKEVGIVAKLTAHTEPVVQFQCYQFRKEVYERCADRAGLVLSWKEPVLPDDERKETGFWDRWVARPTISIVGAVRK